MNQVDGESIMRCRGGAESSGKEKSRKKTAEVNADQEKTAAQVKL